MQSRPESDYAKYTVELRKGARVGAIDPGHRTVQVVGGEEVPYSSLIVATGGRNRRPPDEVELRAAEYRALKRDPVF